MRSLDWNDMHITADEYFAILREAWEKSEFFDGWDRNWHPEDLHANLGAVFDGVGCGLTAYTHLVGKKYRDKAQNTVSYAGNDHTQVFGGTLPRGEWDNYEPSPVPSRGSRRDVFGDNA